MIISRTPYRISFFGGGTDYPVWYRKYGGAVLGVAINRFCYISCRNLPPFFQHRYRVVWSKIENCNSIDEITHPAVRATLKFLNYEQGIEIHHDGDLPARSGMGSSSAFTVGLLNALYALIGKMPEKRQLALDSIHIERNVLKETVGSQDQILAAYGGLNYITFNGDDDYSIRPVTISTKRSQDLNNHLLLFYTGIQRTSGDVANSYVSNIENKKHQLRITKDMAKEGLSILTGNRELKEFGELLHEAWHVKRSLSDIVSSPKIDDIYQQARDAGAIGGKLTGAGGGGFLLLFVPPDCHNKVKERLNKLIYVPFKFESTGSQVIFYQSEEDCLEMETYRRSQSISPFVEADFTKGIKDHTM
jgi:D-glycero-alpha-D-manno-heptose-7-phosphate kinase